MPIRRLEPPPSGVTGALGQWLASVWRHLEAQPNISIASLSANSTPDSYVTGLPGDLCVNAGSGSTSSRLWVLGGTSRSDLTNQGWALVRVRV